MDGTELVILDIETRYIRGLIRQLELEHNGLSMGFIFTKEERERMQKIETDLSNLMDIEKKINARIILHIIEKYKLEI